MNQTEAESVKMVVTTAPDKKILQVQKLGLDRRVITTIKWNDLGFFLFFIKKNYSSFQ